MAQGYTGYTIVGREVTIADSPNLDAFSRFRVSNPLNIFNNQFTYDITPLVFEAFLNIGTVSHDATNRLATLTMPIGGTVGDYVYMQSYEYIPYQPGRSQLVFLTFNLVPPGSTISDVTRVAGLGDDYNGFFFKIDGVTSTLQFEIKTTTSAGTQIVNQSSWNLDKLDGTGASGATLDVTKTQILVIDFQALYVGRVRMGFDINGQIIYAHEFLNCNNTLTLPYIATANLPIRIGMEGTVVVLASAQEVQFVCCSVSSEGGVESIDKFGYTFALSGVTNITGPTYIASLRPTISFNSYINRTKFILSELEFINIGNRSISWTLGIGASIVAATYNSVNASYSAMEYDTAGSIVTPTTITIDAGYVPTATSNRGATAADAISSRYPITLDAAGNQRDLGTLTLEADILAAGSTDLHWTMKWKEIR